MTQSAVPGLDLTAAHRRYTGTAAGLHWLIAALIGANLVLGFVAANTKLPIGDTITALHKVVGILILALSLFRLAWRLTHRPPAFAFASALQRHAAGLVHVLLYGLMIAVPCTGWLLTSSFPKRHPISLGPIHVPFLPVTPDLPRAIAAHTAHVGLATAMLLLVAGHALAALYHHFVLKDGLLARLGWRTAD